MSRGFVEIGLALGLVAATGALAMGRGRGLLLADGRIGGGAKGFDHELELCSDQPIIVCVIFAMCKRSAGGIISNIPREIKDRDV